jgi:hypothetical protein
MIDFDYYRKTSGTYGVTDKKDGKIEKMASSISKYYDNVISEFDILIKSNRADAVIIDGIQTKALIDYNSSFTLSKLKSNVSTIQVRPNEMKVGSYVEVKKYTDVTETITHLVTEIESMRLKYMLGYMTICNNSLTYKNSLNIVSSIPCIIDSQVVFTDGLVDEKYYKTSDKIINVQISKNEDTSKFYLKQRFVINHNKVFYISSINDYGNVGILTITMNEDIPRESDDLINNIAEQDIPQIITPIPTGKLVINGTNPIYVGDINKIYTIAYDNGNILEGDFDFTIDDTSIARIITKTDLTCNISAIGTGQVKLTATNKIFDTITTHVILNVNEVW